MNTNETYVVSAGYESLFEFSEKDQITLDALWIAAQFLSKIQDEMNAQGITRKELAARIGTSASWLTQLFRGDKLPSFETIAELQHALGLQFDIKPKNELVSVSYQDSEPCNKLPKIVPIPQTWGKNNMAWGKVNYNNFDEGLEQPARGQKHYNYQAA